MAAVSSPSPPWRRGLGRGGRFVPTPIISMAVGELFVRRSFLARPSRLPLGRPCGILRCWSLGLLAFRLLDLVESVNRMNEPSRAHSPLQIHIHTGTKFPIRSHSRFS